MAWKSSQLSYSPLPYNTDKLVKGFVHIHGRILGTSLNIRYLKSKTETDNYTVILNKTRIPIRKSEVINVCIVLMPVFLSGYDRSFLGPFNKPIISIPHASLSVWGAKNVLVVPIFLRFSENVSSWCTIIYITNHLLLSCTHEWKHSDFRRNTCSYRSKGNPRLTLCFAAISWPCSELTFLRWTKSTLLATNTIGKASLRGSQRQKPEQPIFNSHPGG